MRNSAVAIMLLAAALGANNSNAQTLASLNRHVTALETQLAQTRQMIPPIGSVVAVALTPAEVTALRPFWVPADGSLLNDPVSPLNGRKLPNLVGRLPLGLKASLNAAEDSANTVGGGLPFTGAVTISATTQGMVVRNCTPFMPEARLAFGGNAAVNDTPRDESACDHTHLLAGTFSTAPMDVPLPPFRALIYLIRVR